jgi:hypothetical protein
MDDINIITVFCMVDATVSYQLSSFVLRPSSFVFTFHVLPIRLFIEPAWCYNLSSGCYRRGLDSVVRAVFRSRR